MTNDAAQFSANPQGNAGFFLAERHRRAKAIRAMRRRLFLKKEKRART